MTAFDEIDVHDIDSENDEPSDECENTLSELTRAFKAFGEEATTAPARAVAAVRSDATVQAAVGRAIECEPATWASLAAQLENAGVDAPTLKELSELAKSVWNGVKGGIGLTGAAASITTLKPRIVVNRQLSDVIDDASRALVAANVPPTVFRHGGMLVRLAYGPTGLCIEQFSEDALKEKLSRVAIWGAEEIKPGTRRPRRVFRDRFPPKEVVRAMLATPSEKIPELAKLALTPFFTDAGELVTEPGYHPGAKTYLVGDDGLVVPDVPAAPTTADVAAAKALLGELLCGFMWATPGADEAHYIALLLEQVCRELIDSVYPLHLIEAPESRSGKSLLLKVVGYIFTGRCPALLSFAAKEDERAKVLLAALRAGSPCVFFDNAKVKIESAVLEAILTSSVYQGRLLGLNQLEYVLNAASWAVTVNGAEVGRDMAGRIVRSRLDTKMEHPEERADFKHPDLLAWVKANRGALVHALLVLVRNWLAAGRPAFSGTPKASFEAWSRVIGGILETAGYVGFLDKKVTAEVAETDPEKEEFAAFVSAWWSEHKESHVTAKELLRVAAPPEVRRTPLPLTSGGQLEFLEQELPNRDPAYLNGVIGGGSPGTRSTRLGRWLSRNKGRVVNGIRIDYAGEDTASNVKKYRLVNQEAASAEQSDKVGEAGDFGA